MWSWQTFPNLELGHQEFNDFWTFSLSGGILRFRGCFCPSFQSSNINIGTLLHVYHEVFPLNELSL